MKKIGLVGGTGPESTVMYYKELNNRIAKMTNGAAMPDIVIESVNFPKTWGLVTGGKYEELADYLSEKVESLKAGGAEIISLTAGTMHIVYDEIVQKTNTSPVSIPKAIRDEAVSRGIKKVGLLGTIFTMEQDYMKKDLTEAGIDVVIPKKPERELIAKRIFEELESGIVKESTLKEFTDIIKRMQAEDGIEAVILGCTELPLLLNGENCPVCCLDSVEIHLNKLIELALQDKEIVESERFTMRRLMPDDYKLMAAWDMDERVYKYLLGNA
ncbi:MAG: amino acid racemase, partial [Lachnospiraceae bacterium]|nr:amino acid racemase [Lachnospiraceae bacterium]